MKTPTMLIVRAYSEITPESAEHGDFSDTGIVHDAEPYTFRELHDAARLGGFSFDGGTRWADTGFSVVDYRTGTERSESLSLAYGQPARLEKWFRLAIDAASRRRFR